MTIVNLGHWLHKQGALQQFRNNRNDIHTRNVATAEQYFQTAQLGTSELYEIHHGISHSLSWGKTPEGFEYWLALSDDWCDHIEETYKENDAPFKLVISSPKFKLKATIEN